MLFGKPPFTASNMVELIKNIHKKPLEIPRRVNNISKISEDVIRRMLVVDPHKRIGWDELFHHNINNLLEDKIKKNLEETMKD